MTGVCEPRLKASAATLPAMVSVVVWAEVGTAACSAQMSLAHPVGERGAEVGLPRDADGHVALPAESAA